MISCTPTADRVARIRRDCAAPAGTAPADPVRQRILGHLAQVERLTAESSETSPCGGSPAHPLGINPPVETEILFHLDCCEALLRHRPQPSRDPDHFLYPSWSQAISCRILATVLWIKEGRGWARYVPPRIFEVFYLRSPSWLAPVFRAMVSWQRRGQRPAPGRTQRGRAGGLRNLGWGKRDS